MITSFTFNLIFVLLFSGDEILSVNGQSLSSVTHTDALNIFKGIKSGEVILQVARREKVA